MYCFSNYLMRDPHKKVKYLGGEAAYKAGQWSLKTLERTLSGEGTGLNAEFYRALLEVSEDGRRCPVQWGALGDPFDNIERQQGWGLRAMEIFEKYEQPVRASTKGGSLLLDKKYLDAFRRRPELYWIAWSMISIDDEIMARIDKSAPPPSARLAAIKALTDLGVKCSLRLRPILPGVTDRTPRYKHAWRDLLRASRDAGACSVSMEFAFVPGAMPPHVKHMWGEIENTIGIPLVQFYRDTTSVFGSCLRSSRAWKEDLTFAIYEESKRLGFNFGVSDPHWKELNDFGCCCGIPPDDPYFGGWQRKNATNAVVRARQAYDRGEELLVSAADGVPAWADRVEMGKMVCVTGPRKGYADSHFWGDKLRETWNDVRSPRGPLQYFEGILVPVKRDADGNVMYRYQPPKRRDQSVKVPYWHV
jgi:DNA repair photolyase